VSGPEQALLGQHWRGPRWLARGRRVLATPSSAWVLGAGIVLFFVVVALAAPWLAPYNPAAYTGAPLERPGATHLLGTNDVGQDILSELIYGTRISLLIGVLAGGLTLALASLVGMFAGYVGGSVDHLLMRLVDVLMAIPHLPLMILVVAYVGPGLSNIILLIAFLGWMIPARAIRSQILSLRSRGYIKSAELFGAGPPYVIRRHLIPAVAPILAAGFVAQAARAITLEAGLAFLGLGDPTAKSWGLMIRHALDYAGIYFTPHWVWWLLPPGLGISLLILGFTFIGVALEMRTDPRLQRHKLQHAVRTSSQPDTARPQADGARLG
jgi:peptide/nickel transport system permease protein